MDKQCVRTEDWRQGLGIGAPLTAGSKKLQTHAPTSRMHNISQPIDCFVDNKEVLRQGYALILDTIDTSE